MSCLCTTQKSGPGFFVSPAEVPLKDVGVDFIGSRSGVDDRVSEPDISEQDKLHFFRA